MDIKDEINYLKNQTKILPNAINNLEIENKNLVNKRIILDSYIKEIKIKIIELENNKKKIQRNLTQMNNLYE